jgi:hypothetical protein
MGRHTVNAMGRRCDGSDNSRRSFRHSSSKTAPLPRNEMYNFSLSTRIHKRSGNPVLRRMGIQYCDVDRAGQVSGGTTPVWFAHNWVSIAVAPSSSLYDGPAQRGWYE